MKYIIFGSFNTGDHWQEYADNKQELARVLDKVKNNPCVVSYTVDRAYYILDEASEGRNNRSKYETKGAAMREARYLIKFAKVFGIRRHVEVEICGKIIFNRRTTGTKYARG